MEIQVKNPFSLFGGKISFRFDILAWVETCRLNNLEFWELEKLNEQELMLSLIYTSYLSACMYRFKRPKYSFKYIIKVYKHYYVNDYKVIDSWKQAILRSKILGKTAEEWSAEGEKKK